MAALPSVFGIAIQQAKGDLPHVFTDYSVEGGGEGRLSIFSVRQYNKLQIDTATETLTPRGWIGAGGGGGAAGSPGMARYYRLQETSFP